MTREETVTISFVGTVSLKEWLTEEAHRRDRSVSSLIRQILDQQKEAQETAQDWLDEKINQAK